MTTNKKASLIVKLFFQTNNEFEIANEESIASLLTKLEDEGLTVEQLLLDSNDYINNEASVVVDQDILVYMTNNLDQDKFSKGLLREDFQTHKITIVIVLKFGKSAQVRRISDD